MEGWTHLVNSERLGVVGRQTQHLLEVAEGFVDVFLIVQAQTSHEDSVHVWRIQTNQVTANNKNNNNKHNILHHTSELATVMNKKRVKQTWRRKMPRRSASGKLNILLLLTGALNFLNNIVDTGQCRNEPEMIYHACCKKDSFAIYSFKPFWNPVLLQLWN